MKRKPLNLFLSSDERQAIKEKADIVNMKLSQFIRSTALNKTIKPCLDKPTRSAIARLSNNTNQIAKIGNTYGTVSKQDIDALRLQALEIISLIRKELR